jgi:hypothetical protein
MKMRFEIPESTKSYVDEKTLTRKIAELGFENFKHLVCRNRHGRWTAVFFDEKANPVIFAGFMWVR